MAYIDKEESIPPPERPEPVRPKPPVKGYVIGEGSWNQLIGVHPELGFMVTEAIKITPVDFTVFDGIRTEVEQSKLVASGASKTMDSYHLYGLAVDLVPWINGQPRWEIDPTKRIVTACKQVIKTHGLDIDNGWDLWGWDMYHFQLTGKKPYYDVRKFLPDLVRQN
jgi:peptidoglycan L-alanyl-D-glutamate endopeptidase CwlK